MNANHVVEKDFPYPSLPSKVTWIGESDGKLFMSTGNGIHVEFEDEWLWATPV